MLSKYFGLLSLFSISLVAGATDPIEIVGTKWFNSKSGEEFIMKGVAYQPGGSGKQDPIANTSQLANAIKLFKELGINTIRVYETYPTNNHDQGMKMLSDAGIYVIFDLSNPKTSINRSDPKYDTTILKAFTDKADAFAKYDNTLAYFAGNEVNNDLTNTDSNPFVKATIRDMKAHMKAQKRYIPIGYANNDDSDTLQNIVDYFNCGKSEERIDFFGYNIYSWCKADDDMKKSGYDKKTDMFKNYGIPVFFSEYGCNTAPPRQFGDIPALYSAPMNEVFSGGLIYEFTEEANNYGLVKVDGDNFTKMDDFDTYKKRLEDLKLSPTSKSSYKAPSNSGTTCPSGSSWKASNTLPPTPSIDACSCLTKSYGCAVGKSFNVSKTENKVDEIFKFACGEGKVDCTRLAANGESGKYGDLSSCDPATQLSYALNSMYTANKNNKDSCTGNNGAGEVQNPSGDKESTCLSKLANLQQAAGSSGNNGHFLLPSFASLATATIVAALFI
jgi:hypothetical protein